MALNNAINSPLLGNIAGALPVASGGTGATSLTAGVLLGNGTSAVSSVAVLTVANGGTGLGTLTAHSLYVGNGTGNMVALGAATNGQVVIGSTDADPVLASITGAGGIVINVGAGTIEVDGSGITGGFTWTAGVTTSTVAANSGSFVSAGSQQTLTLPATTLVVGDTFSFSNVGSFATAIKIQCASGQAIKYGSTATTTAGTLTCSAANDGITIVCYDATSGAEKFIAIPGSQGAWTAA